MSDVWYCSDNKKTLGPFTLEQLKATLPSIQNAQDLLVWRNGFKDWQRAGSVPELFAEAIVPPPLPAIGQKNRSDVTQASTSTASTLLIEPPKKRHIWWIHTRRIILFSILGLGIVTFVNYSNDKYETDKRAEEQYLKEHPLTRKQLAANEHFLTCAKYKRMPSSVWSDNRRSMMLNSEGCYSDDRDDPRYGDASYPWNGNAPQPWKK